MPLDADRQTFLQTYRDQWLSVEEAAFVLKTTRDTIFAMLHHGLAHRREGKVIRIHVDDLRPPQPGGAHDTEDQYADEPDDRPARPPRRR